jgi:hypothetical protein
VEPVLVTTLYDVSSGGSLTWAGVIFRTCFIGGIENVGQSVSGCVGFIGSGGFYPLCASYVIIQVGFLVIYNCSS